MQQPVYKIRVNNVDELWTTATDWNLERTAANVMQLLASAGNDCELFASMGNEHFEHLP